MRLRTFGGLAITNGGGAVDEARLQRRQLALLAVLAAEAPAGVTRDRLLSLFWPDKDTEKARHALDQLLYGIRRALGAEVLISGPANLAINAAVLPSDAAEFAAATTRGDHEAAAAAYAGPFLDGVHLSDAPEFERWADGRRAHFAKAFVHALTLLAAGASATGDYTAAVGHLRRAAASDPLSGSVAQALILALAYGGNTSAALEAARIHATMVREELDAEPDQAVGDLILKLQARHSFIPPAVLKARATTAALELGAVEPTASRSAASHPQQVASAAPRGGKLGMATLALVGVVLLAILVVRIERGPDTGSGATLRDRTQVTTSDHIRAPAISADGKYLAYLVTDCAGTGCTQAVEITEVGATVTRRVLEGARKLDYVKWSPDGRNLLVAGIVPGPNGDFEGFSIMSALGGAPAPLCVCAGAFFAGGDSLLLSPDPRPGAVFWAYVATLDGVVRDSIRVAGPGEGINFAQNVPGTSLFVLEMRHYPLSTELRVIDRSGRELDRRMMPWDNYFQVSSDAVWMMLDQSLVRIPLNAKTGRISALRDTMYTGVISGFDVTPDGSHLVLDEGTEDFDLWGLDFQDALRGVFAPERRRLHRSAHLALTIAPDGSRLMVARWEGASTALKARLSVIPFKAGAESPLPVRGWPGSWTWVDSVTLAITLHEPDGTHFVLVDSRNGAQLADFAPGDTALTCCALPVTGGGWAWVPADGRSLRVQRPGDAHPRFYPKPDWFTNLSSPGVSPDGQRILYAGGNPAEDSVRVAVLSLKSGESVPWLTRRAALDLAPFWLKDGSVLVVTSEAEESWSFYRLRAPGKVDSLGTIPRPVWGVEVSADLKRAAITTRDYRADAWMYRVERR
jgi:DNA-binding SARP family transcriptional activator